MKKIFTLIIFVLLLVNNIRAEYSDTITETVYSTTDTIIINNVIGIVSDSTITNNKVLSLTLNFSNYYTSDSYVVYINSNAVIDTRIISDSVLNHNLEIGDLKNQDNYIYILAISENHTNADTLYFRINTDLIALYDFFAGGDYANIIISLNNYSLGYDSYWIMVNNDTQVNKTIITDSYFLTNITLLENQNNEITVMTDFDSFSFNILSVTQTDYSMPDTIIIFAEPFTFNLIEYKNNFERVNKLSEKYTELSKTKFSWEKWNIIAINEDDNYYTNANMEYLKFQRLADKYK
jgi:hypothetical protein